MHTATLDPRPDEPKATLLLSCYPAILLYNSTTKHTTTLDTRLDELAPLLVGRQKHLRGEGADEGGVGALEEGLRRQRGRSVT